MFCPSGFEVVAHEIDPLTYAFTHEHAGAVTHFEGRVRSLNNGLEVTALEYEVYQAMALAEGRRIIEEAKARFDLLHLYAVHRFGLLQIGDIALYASAASLHRREAFEALMWTVDEIKARVPIWKKEHYLTKKPEWVACHTCAHGHHHAKEHAHADH